MPFHYSSAEGPKSLEKMEGKRNEAELSQPRFTESAQLLAAPVSCDRNSVTPPKDISVSTVIHLVWGRLHIGRTHFSPAGRHSGRQRVDLPVCRCERVR